MTDRPKPAVPVSALSPFSLEYIVAERIPLVDDVTGPGVYRDKIILTTDDFDVAHGTLAGLKMQCGRRSREGMIGRMRQFVLLSRVVTPWVSVEGTTAFLEAAKEGLTLYDLAHGWSKDEDGTGT